MTLIVTCASIFLLLVANEWWGRRYGLHSEFSRKFIHIVVGSFVALWPFFLSWNQIRLMSIIFLVVVWASKSLHIFMSIHSVTRPTWGELYFALAVGLTTFVTQDKWIYVVALLQMSLADGLAAVVGVSYGKSNSYKVWRQQKSLAGSGTFLLISYLLLLSYGEFIHPLNWLISLFIAIAATAIENVSPRGLDNALVPLFVACSLRLLG